MVNTQSERLKNGLSPGDVLREAAQRLAAAGCGTPRLDAEVILAHALNRERSWLHIYAWEPLAESDLQRFYSLLERREQREPVAYITGYKEFFGLEFAVNPHVLIPRPETELLVETALEIAAVNQKKRRPFTIVDAGTGSGCIAVALAKNIPAASVLALDLSAEALSVARRNAIRHQVADRINFFQADLLTPLAGEPVDLIVSNPPYVSRAELAAPSMQPEVSRYEPRPALEAANEGLSLIQELLPQAGTRLKSGGSLLVEIGAAQGHAVRRLAEVHFPGFDLHIRKDLAGLDRLLVVSGRNFSL